MSDLLRHWRSTTRHSLQIYGDGWARVEDVARILGATPERIRFVISTSRSETRSASRFESRENTELGDLVRATDKSELREPGAVAGAGGQPPGRPRRGQQHPPAPSGPPQQTEAAAPASPHEGPQSQEQADRTRPPPPPLRTAAAPPHPSPPPPRTRDDEAAPSITPDTPAEAKSPAPTRPAVKAPPLGTGPPPRTGGAAPASTAPAPAALASSETASPDDVHNLGELIQHEVSVFLNNSGAAAG